MNASETESRAPLRFYRVGAYYVGVLSLSPLPFLPFSSYALHALPSPFLERSWATIYLEREETYPRKICHLCDRVLHPTHWQVYIRSSFPRWKLNGWHLTTRCCIADHSRGAAKQFFPRLTTWLFRLSSRGETAFAIRWFEEWEQWSDLVLETLSKTSEWNK